MVAAKLLSAAKTSRDGSAFAAAGGAANANAAPAAAMQRVA
jgi:hypothetical protein